MNANKWSDLADKLYNINRQISLEIALTKNIIEQERLITYNKLLGHLIKSARKRSEELLLKELEKEE